MAILSNLLVNGTSRLLGKLYCSDLDVSGTTSFAGVSATTLNVSGEATISGTLVLAKHTQTAATSYRAPALVVGGTSTQSHIEYSYDCIQGKANATTASPVYINYYGGRVYLSNSNKAYADNGTLVANTINADTGTFDDLNVVNTLRANRYSVQQLSNLGGAFYVSPTLSFPNSGTTLTVTKSSTALTLVITDSSITTANLAGITWTANSRVKVSGTINGVVTGTMDGTITSINTSSHALTLSVSGENWNNVVAGTYSASQFSDLSVMVYQRKVDSNDYRVGIWLNCYDMQTETASMRIYGGTSSAPNVMLGNLTNAGLDTVNGMKPEGWGLFAQNAYLHGHIVANAGKIGGFTLGTESMYSGDNFPNTDNFYLMPTGSQSATYNIAGSGLLNNWVMTSGTTFGVTKAGAMYSTSGKIGGWNITASSLFNGTSAMNSNTAGLYLGTDGIRNYNSSSKYVNIQNGVITAVGANISGVLSAGVNSTIGPWTISDSSIWKTNAAWGNATAGAAYFGNSGISITDQFTVSATGDITAKSGSIGGWTIDWGSMRVDSGEYRLHIVSDPNNQDFLVVAHHTKGLNVAATEWPFWVHKDGAMHATKGDIAGFTIADNAIYNGITSIDATGKGLYIGTDGIRCCIYDQTTHTSTFVKIADGKLHATNFTGYKMQFTGYFGQILKIQSNEIVMYSEEADPDTGAHQDQLLAVYTPGNGCSLSISGKLNCQRGFSSSSNSSVTGNLYVYGASYCYSPYDNSSRRCVTSSTADKAIVSHMYASSTNGVIGVYAQYGASSYSSRAITTTTSDIRLKHNIFDTNVVAIPFIKKIKLRQFDWINNEMHKSIGFIADELETLNPELVGGGGYDENGALIAKYIDNLQLSAYLVKAIQEQQAEIESLKKQLASM